MLIYSNNYSTKLQVALSTLFLLIDYSTITIVVCSRILLGRHHVSDVVAGVLIGYAEYRYIFLEYGVAMRYTFSSCMKIPQGAIHDLLHSVANCMFRAT